MLTRRQFAAISLAGFAASKTGWAQQTSNQFDQLLNAAIEDERAIADAQQEREGLAEFYDYFSTKTTAPRYEPSKRSIDSRAVKMIVGFEVSSQARYIRELQFPIWPKGQSGITIGIGYDVGYVKPEWLREDWRQIVPAAQMPRLEAVCGLTGTAAKEKLTTVRDIRVPWDAAYRQFTTTALPRFVAETLAVLPNASELNDACLGALVSLTYNRGASYKKLTSRYREMRAIRQHMVRRDFAKIPAELRAMKRIWAGNPNMRGLLTRRELEAVLFEDGLRS